MHTPKVRASTPLSVSDSYMLKCLEALEIIEDVYAAIKGWCQTTTELQIPIKLLESYYIRWS